MTDTQTLRGLSQGERVAMIISECQRAMVDPEFRDARDVLARNVVEKRTLPAIESLAAVFRAHGHPVVHSWLTPYDDWRAFSVNCALSAMLRRADACREGSLAMEPAVEPLDGDIVVARRTGLTSFEGTELDAVLRAMRIETVVIVGVSINVAVLGSTLEAVNRGYNVMVPADAVAGVGATAESLLADIYPLLATVTDCSAIESVLGSRVVGDRG